MRPVTPATRRRLMIGAVLAAVGISMLPGGLRLGGAQPLIVTVPLTGSPEQPQARVDIDASPEQVWTILTDFPAYPIWNPFIYPVKGAPRPNSLVEITLHPGTGPVTYKATVLTAQPNRELSWTGQILSAGVYAVTFLFTIEALSGGGARLEAREHGKGVAPIGWWVEGDIPRGLDQMVKALRNRAELLRVPPHPSLVISTPRK